MMWTRDPKRLRPFPRTQSPASLARCHCLNLSSCQKLKPMIPLSKIWLPSTISPRCAKPSVYRELGTVNHIDNTWKFCIIRPVAGTDFAEHDPLHVLWDEGDVYAALRVCAIERGAIVADMGKNA